MKKSKGFTMIELLATIIILGLLITIAYTSVRNILNRGNNTYYESQENMIVLAGQDYFADYREKLPDEIGDTASVTLETLINESYIDPVKDDDENDCDFPGSRVFVQKITDRDYQYFVTLVCNRYETTEDTADPVITFNPNKKSSTKSITVKMDVTDNEGVASYRYVIEKDGELYRDSGYLNYNGELTIKLTEKGLYEITGYAIDVNGNKSNKKSGKFSIYEGINCAEVDFSSSAKAETWINKNITLTIKLPDNTYRWELSKSVNGGSYQVLDNYIGASNKKLTINSDGKHKYKLTVYDSDGNSCIATTEEYYVDKTKPTCESSGGSEEWKNTSITLKGTCKDTGGSGCTGNVTKNFTTNTNKTNQSPGTVKDNAGNIRTCPANQTVKIDKNPPTCQSSGGSTSWKNTTITLKGTCSDTGGSGCRGNVSKPFTSDTNLTNQSPGTVYDRAGNSTVCPANQTVRVDKTAPSCTSGGGSSNWTNKNVTITGVCSDGSGSGCAGNASKTYTSNTNTSNASPGIVKDNAGNIKTCPANQTVKIDKTAPSCSNSGGNSSWTNQNVTIKGTCSDSGGSGCRSNASKTYTSNTNTTTASPGTVYDRAGNSTTCPANQTVRVDKTAPRCTTSGSTGKWTNRSVTLIGYCSDTRSGCTSNTITTTVSNNVNSLISPGRVRDKAGNSTLCPSTRVRVDKTAPSCTSSGGSSTWRKTNLTIRGTCSDSGGSGCTGNASKTYSSNTNTTTASPGIVRDAAGNTKTCPANQTVKIDKTAPKCTSSGGSTSWTTGSRTLKGTCSDTGGSGCTGNVTRKFTDETNVTGQSPGTVYDIAGNSTTCPANQTVRIDKTAPTLTASIDNGFLGQAQLRENGKGKTYSDINLTPPTISFSYSDSGSGINTNSVSASCSATDNLGKKYTLDYTYSKTNRTIKLNINTANPIVINASCTISVKDNVGKSSSKTISTKIGNGWYKTGTKQICGQPPSYGYKNDCYNDSYWYYYRQGSKVTGWQKIYWYNPSLPEGADRWYYFYTGSEKAINSCYGRPATELATGWCYNVGGYEGWYYLYEPGGKADKTKDIWHSTGAMFDNVTFELYSKTYGWETFTVGPGGKCISGRGC